MLIVVVCDMQNVENVFHSLSVKVVSTADEEEEIFAFDSDQRLYNNLVANNQYLKAKKLGTNGIGTPCFLSYIFIKSILIILTDAGKVLTTPNAPQRIEGSLYVIIKNNIMY